MDFAAKNVMLESLDFVGQMPSSMAACLSMALVKNSSMTACLSICSESLPIDFALFPLPRAVPARGEMVFSEDSSAVSLF